jgi:diacylglycerol kinase (ATP)
MPLRNALIICNPTSGRGAYKAILPDFESKLKNAGWRYEIAVPSSEDDTRYTAQESSKRGFDSIIAVGGDGTIHTILEGMDVDNQSMGIVPLGSGNDIFRMLKIKNDPIVAIDNVINGGDWKIDLGMCNDTRFLNTAGIGIDSETLRIRRQTRGFVKRNYVLLFLKTLGQLKPFRVKVTADGDVIEDDFMWVIVCNNNYIGGGMKIAPHAVQDDGFLDLTLIRTMSRFRMVLNVPGIFSGEFAKKKEVSTQKVREIKFETEKVMELGVDGDLFCTTPATIRVLTQKFILISKHHAK